MGRAIHILILFVALLCAGPVWAVEPAVLVHDDLRREPVQLVGYGQGRLRYFGADRSLTAIDSSKAVRLEFGREISAPATGGGGSVLRLTDGQVLRGNLGGAGDGGEQLVWETTTLGPVQVGLDDVSSMSVSDGGDLPVAGESDIVLLANGDRLSGFVEAVSAAGLNLDRDGQSVDLAWEAISGVVLANLARRGSGVWLTLIDGSRLRVEALTLTGSHAAGTAFGQPFEVPMDRAARVDFTQRHRLVPLDELPQTVMEGGTAFGVEYPPRFEPGWLSLHAPVTVRYELPAGARRFAADAAIAPGASAAADPPGGADMVLIVSDGQTELFKERLNADQPRVRINVELTGPALELRLDDAVGGPVLDRLRLENPAVLVTPD